MALQGTAILKSLEDRNSVSEGSEPSSSLSQQSDSRRSSPGVGSAKVPEHQYSREELLDLRSNPLSKKRPACLDPEYFNNRGKWDPEYWHPIRKRLDTPDDDKGGRGDAPPEPHNKRKSGDPRERIRKEQDGIILSPQRRSFNTGCHVSAPPQRRSESPLDKGDREVHREIPGRRIGSGRIPISRDIPWESFRADREKDPEREFNYSRRGRDRDRNDSRYERRNYGRDFERDERDPRVRNRNYNDRRRSLSDSREEEPEWVSGGPTSQHDTIELRGFEDIPEEGKIRSTKDSSGSGSGRSSRRTSPSVDVKGSNSRPGSAGSKRSRPTTPISHVPTPEDVEMKETDEEKTEVNSRYTPMENGPTSGDTLNLEDILMMDSLPGLNATPQEGYGGSRFSQFFSRERESPNANHLSRRSSLQDEFLNHLIGDFSETTLNIPSVNDSDKYRFVPISPVENSHQSNKQRSGALLEMLQRGPLLQNNQSALKNLAASGKLHSVEELEAGLKQRPSSNATVNSTPSHHMNKEDELFAFKKLVLGKQAAASVSQQQQQQQQQVLKNVLTEQDILSGMASGGGFGQHHNQQSAPAHPTPILGPSQVHSSSNLKPPSSSAAPTVQGLNSMGNVQVPQELLLRLVQVQQQQQQENLNKMMSGRAHATSPITSAPPPPHPSQDPTLMQRPEAVAISRGLQNGTITLQHIMQQLQNSALQPRQREILLHILKVQMTSGNTPRATSPHPDYIQQRLIRVPSPSPIVPVFGQQPAPVISHHASTLTVPPHMGAQTMPTLNQLSVQQPGLQHRGPSPQELIVHTQQIMQNALIKKKLEEQRENFLKREGMRRANSPNVSITSLQTCNTTMTTTTSSTQSNSPSSKQSPSQLSNLVPTSVMRKMTAEKDRNSFKLQDGKIPDSPEHKADQQHQHLLLQQQQQQNMISSCGVPTAVAPPNRPPQGRPIVKAAQQQSQLSSLGLDQMPPSMTRVSSLQPPMRPPSMAPHMGNAVLSHLNMLQPSLNPAVRAQVLQAQLAATLSGRGGSIQPMRQLYLGNMRGPHNASLQHNHDMNTARRLPQTGSETLANWFHQPSPGAQPMPPVPTQQALSLEEVERLQQSAAVHN